VVQFINEANIKGMILPGTVTFRYCVCWFVWIWG